MYRIDTLTTSKIIMSTHILNKATAISAIKKSIADKAIVRLYLKGLISKKELDQKGIKLGKPI